jgi:hypothetical protein
LLILRLYWVSLMIIYFPKKVNSNFFYFYYYLPALFIFNMNELQIIHQLTNKLLNKYLTSICHLEIVLRVDTHQFLVNRSKSSSNHHNIEIIRFKSTKTITNDELEMLKLKIKSTLNLILQCIEGNSYKKVLHIILKNYSSSAPQIVPSLFQC